MVAWRRISLDRQGETSVTDKDSTKERTSCPVCGATERVGDLNITCTESYGVHHLCRGILIGREPQLVDVEAAARGRAAPGRVAPREEVALARRSRRRGVTQFGRSPRSRA